MVPILGQYFFSENPSIWTVTGHGRTAGLKLKRPGGDLLEYFVSIPSQSATSKQLAKAVLSPINLTGVFNLWHIYLIRDTITSIIGPRARPSKWISSIIIKLTFLT